MVIATQVEQRSSIGNFESNIETTPTFNCVFCSRNTSLEVFSSKNFVVLYDPFPLMPGHLMITTKSHYGCFGEIPAEMIDEYRVVSSRTEQILKESFGSFIRYEHGRAGHCMNVNPQNRFCHHFHEHWVPANVDVHATLKQNYRSYIVKDQEEVLTYFERYGNYFLFENADKEKRFYIVDRKAPPHYIRTLIAIELGYPERQNWEAYSACAELQIEGSLLKLLPNKVYAA